jgi:hypothetical protein
MADLTILSAWTQSRLSRAGPSRGSIMLQFPRTAELTPLLPQDRFIYIRKSSLSDSALTSMSGPMRLATNDIRRMMTNFKLSETSGHTDKHMMSARIR